MTKLHTFIAAAGKRFFAWRKIFFWFHLVAGIGAALFILLMAVTGALLSFESQITDAANGYAIAVPAGGEKLGVEELLVILKAARPDGAPSGLTLRADPRAPAAFQYGRDELVFVNPYTGEVLGPGGVKTRAFFAFVNALHRSLAVPGGSKEIGQMLTAATSAIFVLILGSGLYLWAPRRWTLRGMKAITTFQPRLSGHARDWNWHNVLGIWFALPLLVVTGTGTLMSFHWGSRLLAQFAGEAPVRKAPGLENHGEARAPRSATKHDGHRGVHQTDRRDGKPREPQAWPASTADWNAALAAAQNAVSGWRMIDFDLSQRGSELVFHVSSGSRSRPDLHQTVSVDLDSAAVTKIRRFANQPLERRLHALMEVIHTGGIAGWPGQALAAASALAALMLVWTGLALSWRRFMKKAVSPKRLEDAAGLWIEDRSPVRH